MKQLPEDLETGIYFGWANIDNGDVQKAVLSIGWNPFYENKEKSMVNGFLLKSKFLLIKPITTNPICTSSQLNFSTRVVNSFFAVIIA